MKMLKFVLLAIFLPMTLSAGGFTPVPPEGMPDRLPLGSREENIDWVITNRPAINFVGLTFNDMSGMKKQTSLSLYTQNSSQKEFWDWVSGGAMHLLDSIKMDEEIDPKKDVLLDFSISNPSLDKNGYPDWDEEYISSLRGKENLSTIGMINKDSFSNLKVDFYTIVLPISGLESMTLQVDGQVSYTWNIGKGGQGYPPYSVEPTDIPSVSIYEYYLKNDFDLRFIFKVSGKTKAFTQHGDPLVSIDTIKRSEIPGYVSLSSKIPMGAILTLQKSNDFKKWTYVFCYGEQQSTDFEVEIPITDGHMFYRTYVE